MNDIDLPDEPDDFLPAEKYQGDCPLPQNCKLKSDSMPLNIADDDEDVEKVIDNKIARKVFVNEMKSCDLYLHNLHKSFQFATTVRSVIALVGASIGVHKHRRDVLERASNIQAKDKETVEFDNMGNIIVKGKR